MLEEILDTLKAALDNYDGDAEKIKLARFWLESLAGEPAELEPDELAEIQAAIAESEAEEARGYSISHEELMQKSLERITNHYAAK